MNANAQRRLTPVLGGVAAGFGLLLLLLLAGVGRGVHWGPPRPTAPLPETHDQGMPAPLPLTQFATVWQQPLFNPDRKPSMHTASGGASLGDMQLTGIILTPALHMALLHDKSGEHEVRVREGDSLPDGSWRLVEVKPRAAVFESAGGRTQLDLPAGAPIDAPKPDANANANANANAAPTAAPQPGRMVVAPAPMQSGPVPPGANFVTPVQGNNPLQADRIRQLNEAIQKRRGQPVPAPPEGAH
ncbi:general secretion pathway protein GspN [Dyella solisilvae]|uniref:General secretion pathway protein GspN n=1 Tax=Dyella solisilvae TaxID=1920168 RepID=A0A370K7R7_9GAMM|nr:general secretion pathway protein GspN [Dyella solisilvae]RDI98692.1 general secretion pathway protein GspN [Dyella solisilvae]